MNKIIIATTVAGALKLIVRKEGKKDRVLKTIQEVKGHLDAQSVLVAEKELKGASWSQIKKELLALKESVKTFKKIKFELEKLEVLKKEVGAATLELKNPHYDSGNKCFRGIKLYGEGGHNLAIAIYVAERAIACWDKLPTKKRNIDRPSWGYLYNSDAIVSAFEGYDFECITLLIEKALEEVKKLRKGKIRREVKKNVQESVWARKNKRTYLNYDSLKEKIVFLEEGELSKKKGIKLFATANKEFPIYLAEKISHISMWDALKAIEDFSETPEIFYTLIKNEHTEEQELWVQKWQKEFVDGWKQLSKQVPKIAKVFSASQLEPETVVEIFDFKNLKKALELVPTKFEAMLLTCFLQEKVLLLEKKEACNLAQALVEEWGTATNTTGEELDRIIPQKELLWKFKNESVDFLKKLILSVGPTGDTFGLLKKTKREVRKYIASMEVMNVFSYFQSEYGIGDLETLSCSITENKIEMDGLTARVLAANDPFQVAMGDDSLGGITCCQCKGGAGESCVAEGLDNHNSGFFGIWDEKGLVAQAWVWTNQAKEVLVFDNIELNKGRRFDFDKIEKILLAWCEAAPYKKIQLGLGYTKLNTSNFEEVKTDFILGDFEFDPYTDANEDRVWLKK